MNAEQLAASHPPATRSAQVRAARVGVHRRAPLDVRPAKAARLVNRVLDVTIAAVALLLLAVPLLALAALIRLTSRGPALYCQQRVGMNGKPFMMVKFRTMRLDAEHESGPVWATRDDPRRTALGVVLRRLSIDELPQLFNVLRGDMSIVGPRPERPYFVQEFCHKLSHYNDRHRVKPGITGWAQINGWRGDSSLEKRLEFDLYYVEHWSVAFNLRIMLLTPLRVLFARNAC
jgi:exopolysaccharide biosynthesis polyprenyl glycosylphosphotransferase